MGDGGVGWPQRLPARGAVAGLLVMMLIVGLVLPGCQVGLGSGQAPASSRGQPATGETTGAQAEASSQQGQPAARGEASLAGSAEVGMASPAPAAGAALESASMFDFLTQEEAVAVVRAAAGEGRGDGGRETSAGAAGEAAPGDTLEKGEMAGEWDAAFILRFDPGVLGVAATPQGGNSWRPTWVVQRLAPGPNETYYVDAVTGELYARHHADEPAPLYTLGSTEEAATIVGMNQDPRRWEGWVHWRINLVYEQRRPVWVVELFHADGQGVAAFLDGRGTPPRVLRVEERKLRDLPGTGTAEEDTPVPGAPGGN